MNQLHLISEQAYQSESQAVAALLPHTHAYQQQAERIFNRAATYVESIRTQEDTSLQAFMKEYKLSDHEGVVLMCLAEALLRVPDKGTASALIEDRLEIGEWENHLGKSDSWFVNASTYALLLGAKALQLPTLNGLIAKLGEPVIREGVRQAIKLLGGQFVLAPTIEGALKQARPYEADGYRFSYDMLGEGARTSAQAEAFFQSYKHAILEVSKTAKGDTLFSRPGISIKLSALHPKLELRHEMQLREELLPRVKELALLAAQHNLAIALDAEEQRRLDLSLSLYTTLLQDRDLSGYDGLGYVLQAYGKRALPIVDYLHGIAKTQRRRIPIRLVKGAYWDSEIKYAQSLCLPGYPVYTRKSHTDVSYLACAAKLLQYNSSFYPQFASHNALTVASILETAPSNAEYEFQRLYGMGDTFYDPLAKELPVRIYAPVGSYAELLPYLIRRLLENGANNSFVNLVVDETEPVAQLLRNPVTHAFETGGEQRGDIPLPAHINPVFRRTNGMCLGNLATLKKLPDMLLPAIIPISETTGMDTIVKNAHSAFPAWNQMSMEKRISHVINFTEMFEFHGDDIVSLLVHRGEKTYEDANFEYREALDFCFYYVEQAELLLAQNLANVVGERNLLTREGKGVFACISPWNFPFSIFVGQIVAALLGGNTVIAKPAEQSAQTALFVANIIRQFLPADVFQLVVGTGETVGSKLTSHPLIAGVAFTGGTDTAQAILQSLANRKAPLPAFIAETGGLNVMVVDSTALLEQACDDIINSAFGSAGQRCSSLRLVLVQEEVAEPLIRLIQGAMELLKIGPTTEVQTDIGPIIDAEAKQALENYIHTLSGKAKLIAKAPAPAEGNYLAPHAFLLPDMEMLEREHFGPVLHIATFKRSEINTLPAKINAKGYGLTFGLHSRLQSRAEFFSQHIRAGNIYINRGMTGAMVSLQPFGGMGLSGTGPKAGGPHYLKAFMTEKTVTTNTAALGGDIDLLLAGKHDDTRQD